MMRLIVLLLILLPFSLYAQEGTTYSYEVDECSVRIGGADWQLNGRPVSMEKFQVCDQRGHVYGPGSVYQSACEGMPYVADTDSTSHLVYPGKSWISHPCMRCGDQRLIEGRDVRILVWSIGGRPDDVGFVDELYERMKR